MRLLSVIVSHNRLELTRRAVESYTDTVSAGYHGLVVVDNASTDGTAEWLRWYADRYDWMVARLLPENRRPYAACNLGWKQGLTHFPDAELLHSSDNDVEYLPGWCDEVQERFAGDFALGQLGLLEAKYEQGCANVGGNCVIRRRLWDDGIRWPEQDWHGEIAMSAQIVGAGWSVERVQRPVLIHHGWDWDAYPDYYAQVAAEKNLDPEWVRGHFDRMRAL